MNIVRFGIGLACQARFHQGIQFIGVEALLCQRIKHHGVSIHREGREHTLLFCAQLGENFDGHVIFKRLVEGTSRCPPVDEFQNQGVPTGYSVYVEPLVVTEFIETRQQFTP